MDIKVWKKFVTINELNTSALILKFTNSNENYVVFAHIFKNYVVFAHVFKERFCGFFI